MKHNIQDEDNFQPGQGMFSTKFAHPRSELRQEPDIADKENTFFRVYQAHCLGTFGPVGFSGTAGKRFGRNQLFKMILDRVGHFCAQPTLNVSGTHVLRRLIQSNRTGWEVGGTLLTA